MSSRVSKLLTVTSIIFWGVVLWYAITQSVTRSKYTIIFVGFAIIIYVLSEFEDPENTNIDYLFLACSGIVGVTTTLYLYLNFNELNSVRVGYALNHEYVLASLFTLSIAYLIYRSFGVTFLSIVVIGIGYGYAGNYVPGVLGHGGLSLNRILQILLLDLAGFFGSLTQLVAAWIALFMLFAGLLQSFGALDLTKRIGIRVSEHIKSGIAQTAVIASIIIGSINGSTAANTAMTGSFTIPMMKDSGIKSETAGAIESVASTIGQVLPPIMGAAGFVMASFLSVAYIEVITAATIPAIILIGCITVAVHYKAVDQLDIMNPNNNIVEERYSRRNFTIYSLQFIIPISVLIYTLGVAQWTVMTSALYTCVTMFIVGILGKVIQNSSFIPTNAQNNGIISSLGQGVNVSVKGLRYGAISVAPIAIILLAINGIVDILLATGVPSALALALMSLSGGNVSIALLLAMIISLVMGLGMPTVAAYTVVATLIAPALINQFAIDPMVAHFFVFYCAILASVTPPIATSVAVATGIAQSKFWPTAFEAVRMSLPLFILPFAFISHPILLSPSISASVGYAFLIVTIGSLCVVHGLNSNWNKKGFNGISKYFFLVLYVILGSIIMLSTIELITLISILFVLLLFALQRYVGENINTVGDGFISIN